MELIKPPRLRKGDLIGLVSPASTPAPLAKIEASVNYLEQLGYRVAVGQNAATEYGYLAGTDEQRASDLNAMIGSPEVRAIFALRGGYGTPRLLPLIDYRGLRRRPKIVSGFSDITALQLAIYRKCRLVTFSGPMPAVEFWQDLDPYTEENFWRLLTSARKPGPLLNPPGVALQPLQPGRGEGVLLGGNLSLILSCLGTPYLPALARSILAIEEVDEAPYRIDRLLTQLRHSGLASKLSGLIFGQFTRCEQKDPKRPSLSTAEVLQDFASRLPCPALANLQYGHVPKKLTLPFGVTARLDAKKGRLDIIEPAVS